MKEHLNGLQWLKQLGVPDGFLGALLLVSAVLTLAPIIGGVDLSKDFQIPNLPFSVQAAVQVVMPAVWVFLLVPLVGRAWRSKVLAYFAALALGATWWLLDPPKAQERGCISNRLVVQGHKQPLAIPLKEHLDDLRLMLTDEDLVVEVKYSPALTASGLHSRDVETRSYLQGACAILLDLEQEYNAAWPADPIRIHVSCSTVFVGMSGEPLPEEESVC